jgi:hypothetical protein
VIANLRHIKRNINPYGGILFCMDEIRKMEIPAMIDSHLGKRAKQAKYSYSDTLLSWIFSTMCGSERLEDTKQLQEHFKDIPCSKLPSPDRLAGIFKQLATNTTKFKSKTSDHEFNVNMPMNQLLVDIALKLRLLNPEDEYVMDYDNVIIPCEKYDAKYSYKDCEGYSPGVAFIGKHPIYIEGRNGNTHAKYKMADTIQRAFDLVNEKGIKIRTFRSDAAAYSNDMIKTLIRNNVEFFIRANHSRKVFEEAIDNDDWESVKIGDRQWEITSMDYLYGKTQCRLVITRDTKEKDYKNPHTGDCYIYRAIITNNYTMSNRDVVKFYNKRGSMETNFSQLLEDWNWSRLPFSFMNQNIVFMIVGAIGNILYRHIIKKFSKVLPFVKSSYRLKNFIFYFITVALEWIIEEKEKVPIIYSKTRDYSALCNTE